MAEIAVLIPHYNAKDALKKTIKSIEEDINVDVYIVDDGSTTKPIIDDFNFYELISVFSFSDRLNLTAFNGFNIF